MGHNLGTGDGVFEEESNIGFSESTDFELIGYKWVFQKMDNEQYKIRLVVKGFSQKEDIDNNEIFLL